MKIDTKSRNFRIILFSVIGLAVLAAVIVLLMLTAPKDPDESDENVTTSDTADPALMLQPESLGNIKSIKVENSLGSFTVIRSVKENGDVNWDIEGLDDIDRSLLSSTAFDSLAKAVTDMTARSVIEENASDLAQYGLEKPSVKAEVIFENGSFNFLIGDTVTSWSANYLMVEGNPTVYSYYSYSLSSVINNDAMSFINTAVMPSFDQNNAPDIKKITVTRKDWDKPLILESMPELPEDSTSIQVFAYTFTSPYSVYLDLNDGSDFLNAINGLSAQKAAFVKPTDEQIKETGLDDPFCEVDQLAGDTIYRLYIGDAITQEVKDEETGITKKEITGYYGRSNMVPDVIFIFNSDDLIWASMQATDYMSELFLMPYIYDVDTLSYRDANCDFTVKIEGDNDESHFYIDGEEIDEKPLRGFYQYLVGCRGEEFYTEDAKGDFIAEFTYTYRDDREPSTVKLYSSDDRRVIIEINGSNVFKTKWNYQTRLLENAKAFLKGEEIIQNY
mgnify:CR=1 FL=1